MWLIISIIFVILISSIMDNKENRLTYSELMVALQNGTVKSIELEIDKGMLKTESEKPCFASSFHRFPVAFGGWPFGRRKR